MKVSRLQLDINSEDYDKLIVIANEMDKTTYALIRDLIKYAIDVHGHSEDGEINKDGNFI